MRSRLALILALVLSIFVLAIPLENSVVRAEAPAPAQTPAPAAPRRAPSQNNQYVLFMPMTQRSAVAAPAPQPPSKKGVGLTYHDCDTVAKVGATWEYGWTPQPDNCPGVENIPMLYQASDVGGTVGGNSNWIMGFNEPDSPDQANIPASQAATLWRQVEQLYPNRKLVAPAPSGADPTWLVDFRNDYISMYGTAPRLNALAVHCYAWSANACIQFTQQFEAWAKAWGVPEVWVTEFPISPASPNNLNQSLQGGQAFLNWMESDPMITRYEWFASRIKGTEPWASSYFDTPLVDWNSGALTAFGQMYVAYH